MPSTRERRKEYSKLKRAERVANGQCKYCPRPAVRMKMCSPCLQSKKLQKHELRLRRMDAGLCHECGSGKVPGKLRCEVCLGKHRASRRALKERKKLLGQCLHCQVPVYLNGKRCEAHYRVYQATKILRQQAATASGLCYYCRSNPCLPTSKLCEACYFKHASMRLFGTSKMNLILNSKLLAQQCLCAISGRPLTIGPSSHIDHIIPSSRGGTIDPSNLRWLTAEANILKRDHTDEELFDLVHDIYHTMSKFCVYSGNMPVA